MRNWIFTFLTFACPFTLFAQLQFNGGVSHFTPDFGIVSEKIDETLANSGVLQIDVVHSMVKGKKENLVELTSYRVNSSGYIISKISRYKNGKQSEHMALALNADNRPMNKYYIGRKGDTMRTTFQRFNSDDQILSYGTIDRKGKITYEQNFTYKDSLRTRTEVKKNGKISRTWEYEYYDNGDPKETRWLNRRGNVKYLWNYDCKEEGVEIKRHKDTSTVCIEKTTDPNGNRMEIYLKTYSDGDIVKTIRVINKADKLVSQKKIYGINHKSEYHWGYTYLSDTIMIEQAYITKKNNKVRSNHLTTYNPNGEITRRHMRYYRHGKLKINSDSHFTFDEKGLPIKREIIYSNSGKIYVQSLNYVRSK